MKTMKTMTKICMAVFTVLCCLMLDVTGVMAGEPVGFDLPDGTYAVDVLLEGGSGRAAIETPTSLNVKDQQATVRIVWSSSYYDYMLVGDTKYENLAEEGMNSAFEIPVLAVDEPMSVIADTTAMSVPHEIAYTITIYSDSISGKENLPQEAAKKVIAIALAIIVIGGILNYIVKKKLRA